MLRLQAIPRLVILLFSLIVLSHPAGCAGPKARDGIGVPTVNSFAEAILTDAEVGVATLPEEERGEASAKLAAFRAASSSTDRSVIANEAWPRWNYVRELATKGIDSQEAASLLGPGPAASKRERLAQYETVLRRTANIPP